jgi:L-alanine-DL-glutamate epimerase-like enolase superfamily enzyme
LADTDIRIKQVDVAFSQEMFRTPLQLSSGPIYGCDYSAAVIGVENRAGKTAFGHGGIFLSDLWSFPTAALTHEEKADCMKETVLRLAAILRVVEGFFDPMQLSHQIDQELRGVLRKIAQERNYTVEIPLLLGVVCWSPLDAAIHDAWGRAADRSCYDMYNRECLNDDLSLFLGEDWRGVFPSDFLASVRTRQELWVQHVVGVGDPLTELDLPGFQGPQDGLPVTLGEWIAAEHIRRFKIKLKGDDVTASLDFIRSVYRVAAEQLGRLGIAAQEMKLALDPNEAFRSTEPVEELLARLRESDPDCFAAVEYLEQPTPRDLTRFGFSMRGIDAYKPVIMDESLDDIGNLPMCSELGWSGIALKTCKGQSHVIAAYCWGKRYGKHVTVQDLTNSGLAFVHSARLWSRLELSADSLEYNSRQFAPFSFPEVKLQYPDLFRVSDGRVSLRQIGGVGLY